MFYYYSNVPTYVCLVFTIQLHIYSLHISADNWIKNDLIGGFIVSMLEKPIIDFPTSGKWD